MYDTIKYSFQGEASGPRILQENTGNRQKCKQYSVQKFSGFFPNNFQSVPAGKNRNLAGIHGKKFRKFLAEILLPFQEVSGVSLREPARIF